MDKYKRVPKEKTDHDSIKDNEVRVVATSQHSARNYISYALNLLTAEVHLFFLTLCLVVVAGREGPKYHRASCHGTCHQQDNQHLRGY